MIRVLLILTIVLPFSSKGQKDGLGNTHAKNLVVENSIFGGNSGEIARMSSNSIIQVEILSASIPVNVEGGDTVWNEDIEHSFDVQFVGDSSGTVRYIGVDTLYFLISARMVIDVTGTNTSKDLEAYITVNGVTDISSVYRDRSGRYTSVDPTLLIRLATNDIIGVSVSNITDVTNIDVISATITIIKV